MKPYLVFGAVYPYSQAWADRVSRAWFHLLALYNDLSDFHVLLVDAGSKVDWQQTFPLFPVKVIDTKQDNLIHVADPPADQGITIIRFPTNVGHNYTGGKDGWGRACCQGLQAAIDWGCQAVAHVEGDCLLRGQNILKNSCQYTAQVHKVLAPAMGRSLETNLFVASVPYLANTRFVDRYDWQRAGQWRDVRGVRRQEYVERHVANLFGSDWHQWCLPGGRLQTAQLPPTPAKIGNWYWVTCHGQPTFFYLFHLLNGWGLLSAVCGQSCPTPGAC